jgi:hypothetical protein
MQTRIRIAIILLTVAGLTGVWVVLAPFASRYQAVGDPWITATVHQVATGAALIVVSLAAILTMIGTALHASGTASQAPPEPADIA